MSEIISMCSLPMIAVFLSVYWCGLWVGMNKIKPSPRIIKDTTLVFVGDILFPGYLDNIEIEMSDWAREIIYTITTDPHACNIKYYDSGEVDRVDIPCKNGGEYTFSFDNDGKTFYQLRYASEKGRYGDRITYYGDKPNWLDIEPIIAQIKALEEHRERIRLSNCKIFDIETIINELEKSAAAREAEKLVIPEIKLLA